MKRAKIAFLMGGILVLCAAALVPLIFLRRGEDPGEPLRHAADLLKSARRAEQTSYVRALQLYEKAFSRLEKTSTDLKESLIPQIRLKAEAERSPLACAYLVSQTIGDVGSRAWALASVAAAYADAGDRERASQIFSEALQLAEREEDDYPKVLNLTTIALRYAETIEKGKSAEILSRAIAVAEGIGGPNWKPAVLPPRERTDKKRSVLALVSEAFRSTKEVLGIGSREPGADELEDLADRQQGRSAEDRKRIATFLISSNCIERGRYDEALRAIELIPRIPSKIGYLCRLAEKQAQAGEQEKASTLLSQAHKLLEAMDGASPERYTLQRMAGTYARIGLEDRALEIADKVADEVAKAAIQAEVAECLFTAGRREEALKLLYQARSLGESIISGSDRSTALGYVERAQSAIAEHYAAEGEYDEALRLAEGIDDASRKGELLVKVARKLAEANQKKKALETLSDAVQAAAFVGKDYAKEWLWVDLAAAYFQLGEKQKASQYVSDAIDSARKRKNGSPYYGMESAACEYVRAGKYEVAGWLAAHIRNPEERNRALAEIARTYLEAGKPDEALRIVKQVRTRWLDDYLLPNMARVYAANGRYLDALRVAGCMKDALCKVWALVDIGRQLGKSGVATGKAERKILHEIVQELD
ncbi:MAG: hypothetical protein Q8Q12_22195 [bacterium]|nr:hypothetical protein [bacterium]